MIKLKYLRKGDFFTRKNILYPNEKQVFIRGDYDHSEKKYECTRYSNACDWIMLKGDTEVFTDFIF